MLGLVTDRTQQNVIRRNELSRKGWANMTVAERNEWMGSPMETPGANLFPNGPYYSSAVELEYKLAEIVATSNSPGTYLYAISVIGNAADYENKIFTLSVDEIKTSAGGVPQIALWWHSDDGADYAGASLFEGGSITFNTAEWPNTNKRAYLAAYIYVTTTITVSAGAQARFEGVMLERGDVRHEYAPYTEIVPTATTKGAYNYSDLNRVERVVAEISSLAGLNLATKTDWGMWDIPKVSDMERYLSNIRAIRDYCGSGIEIPSSMNNLTFTYANNIESILIAGYEAAIA